MNRLPDVESIIHIVKKAGDFIRKERNGFDKNAIETKSDNSLVSYVDKKAEELLVEELGILCPSAGFLTEEETANSLKEYMWVIDPLDGTNNYLANIPPYCTNVAFMHKEEICIAVTYEITRDECYYAVKNKGCYCDGVKVKVSQEQNTKQCLALIGFTTSQGEQVHASFIKELSEKAFGFRKYGAAAANMAYVATGRAHVYIDNALYPWDIIPGMLLLQEAGGLCTQLNGEPICLSQEAMTSPIKTTSVIASNHPDTLQYFRKLLQQHTL